MKSQGEWYSNLIPNDRVITGLSTRYSSLAAITSAPDYPIIEMEQIHSNRIAMVDHPAMTYIPHADALITTLPNVYLAVRTADCLPILISHPEKNVIAAIHAGRRSTKGQITQSLFQQLQSQFALSNDFVVWFGPAVCESCYQIDIEKNIHFDLVAENTTQIRRNTSNTTIIESDICTACQHDEFYSYRKGDREKRIYSVIALRDE
ncbi:polyphenol oxidase family protein [bacterium]|jgi:polyphenol oxidase|nr:polyphenol oxidase family protein [bacterium]